MGFAESLNEIGPPGGAIDDTGRVHCSPGQRGGLAAFGARPAAPDGRVSQHYITGPCRPLWVACLQAFGAITRGSNILQLTGFSKFKAGDQVIVEVGGEEGKGRLGTIGVGGVVPAAKDSWSQSYYRSKDVPLALVAKITGVADSGRILTLDKAAATAATNANVHFDNDPILNKVLAEEHQAGWMLILPAGDFAISDKLQHLYHGGWIISGAGKDANLTFSERCAVRRLAML